MSSIPKLAIVAALGAAIYWLGYAHADRAAIERHSRFQAEAAAQWQQQLDVLAAERDAAIDQQRVDYEQYQLALQEDRDSAADIQLPDSFAGLRDDAAPAPAACASTAADTRRAVARGDRLHRELQRTLEVYRSEAIRANEVARQLNRCVMQLSADRDFLSRAAVIR